MPIKKVSVLNFFALLLSTAHTFAQDKGHIRGVVIDKVTTETLPGATISLDKKIGVNTDIDGNYIISAPAGNYTFEGIMLGYTAFKQNVSLTANDTLTINIELTSGNKVLDEVVVSAGKFEQKLSDITVSMEVIKPALIESKGAVALDAIMNQIPGCYISDGQVSIRNGSGYNYGAGSRVLMLVDEMPLISADAGDIKWNYIPIENMEQVEVIKGAASALFGSSALNGVINLRTAYAREKAATSVTGFFAVYDAPARKELKWWKGSSQTQRGINVSHAEKIGNLDLVIGAHAFNNEGYRYLEKESRGRFNTNLRYNFKKVPGLSVGVNTNMMETKGGLFFLWQHADSAYIPQGRTIQNYSNGRFNIDPYITYYSKKGHRYSLRSRYFLTNNNNDKNQDGRSELYYNELQYQKHLKKNYNITCGAVYMAQKVISQTLYGVHRGENIAAYVQADKKIRRLTLSFGLRGEYYKLDTAKTKGSYGKNALNNLPFQPVARFGLNYQLLEYTFIRSSFGQGYRFPTIAEKYINTSVNSLNLFPNTSLQPEKGWSAEVGVKQGFSIADFKGFLDVAGFWMEYDNMMEFVFGYYSPNNAPPTGFLFNDLQYIGFKSQNIGVARINGIDMTVSGAGKIGPVKVGLLMGYTYSNAIDPDYNPAKDTLGLPNTNVLKYRNRHLFKNDIQFDVWKLSIGISSRYTSQMENIDNRFIDPVFKEYGENTIYILPGLKEYREKQKKGDWVHDVRVGMQVSPKVKFSLIINNVMNKEYMMRPGDIQAPTMYMFQTSIKI